MSVPRMFQRVGTCQGWWRRWFFVFLFLIWDAAIANQSDRNGLTLAVESTGLIFIFLTRTDWVSFCSFSLAATVSDSILLDFIQFYWVLLGFTRFFLGFTAFYWVLLGFTGFYWILLGFTGFYWVLLDFTGFWVALHLFGLDWN